VDIFDPNIFDLPTGLEFKKRERKRAKLNPDIRGYYAECHPYENERDRKQWEALKKFKKKK